MPHYSVLQADDAENSLRAVAEGPESGYALEMCPLLRRKCPQVRPMS